MSGLGSGCYFKHFMSEGFLAYLTHTPLASVDELSGDERKPPPNPKPPKGETAEPKAKPKAVKGKPKAKGGPKALPKGKAKSTPKSKPKGKPKSSAESAASKPESEEVEPKGKEKEKVKQKVMKRPSACVTEKSVGKCFYKASDSWGFKKDDRQCYSVPCLHCQS